MKKFIVSIDQGTTSTKVVLYNKNFHVIDTLQKEFKQFFPKNGWVEHDPIEIFKDVKFLIKKLIKKNDIKCSEILSIGIANQRETTVLWDKLSGKPVYKAIVWQDRRTISICEKLINKKLASKIQKITGLVIDPYFSATKIKWLLKNVKKTKKLLKENRLLFGTIDTWLLWNLTEKKSHFTDITNASRTMLYDSNKEEWSKSLLKLLEIPHKILPEVKPNVFDFGYTKIFGSPINIGGMAGDQQASAIGHTCFTLGKAKSTYGTGCFLLMNIGNKFKISKNKLLTSVAYKIGNKKMYCYEGSIFVAGSSIQWLRDKLLMFKNSKETNLLYSKSNKNENIIFVPALTGLGAPHWQPKVRGVIFGLTRNTSINEFVKATIDSISFQTSDLVNAIKKDSKINFNEIRVDGGMVTNQNFTQSLSNILQTNIIKPKNIETTALGAAYLAALSCGLIKNTSEITKMWKSDIIYRPKIKKNIIDKEIKKWKKTIDLLIKYYS